MTRGVRIMRYGICVCFLVLLALLIPGWGSVRAAPDNPGWLDTPVKRTATPEQPTGTPYLQTQYPSETPQPTDTPYPTATWITPTSPPEWTATPIGEPTPTVGVSPDPSPSATPGTDEPHRKATKTIDVTELPKTGGKDDVDRARAAINMLLGAFILACIGFLFEMIRRQRDGTTRLD